LLILHAKGDLIETIIRVIRIRLRIPVAFIVFGVIVVIIVAAVIAVMTVVVMDATTNVNAVQIAMIVHVPIAIAMIVHAQIAIVTIVHAQIVTAVVASIWKLARTFVVV